MNCSKIQIPENYYRALDIIMSHREKGFTLVELSISLVIIGILASAGWSLLKPSLELSDKIKLEHQLDSIEMSIVTFALNNYRLPCPDTNGDGYEANCTTNPSIKTGGVPFATLGLTGREAFVSTTIYGVYRGEDFLDLTLLQERTNNSPGDVNYKNLGDLLKALDLVGSEPISSSQIFITGDSVRTGSEDCNNNRVSNPAFALASGGGRSMNGDTNLFDGVNSNLRANSTGGLCFASPEKMPGATYDDVVKSMNVNALKGLLLSVGYALKKLNFGTVIYF